LKGSEDVAIKEFSTLCNHRTALHFLGDIRALSAAPHPNIVQLLGVTLGEQPLHLVTEYCAGGSCHDLVHNSVPLTDMQAGKICADVAQAMAYLHALEPKILHRNLTSMNVLLAQVVTCSTTIPHATVSDYNLARFTSDTAAGCSAGVSVWMAPEVMLGGFYSEKADVYSFAIFMYEVLYRKMPFEDVHANQLPSIVVAGQRPQLNSGDADSFWVHWVISAAWVVEPSSRPSFETITKALFQVPAFRRNVSL